MTSAMKPLRFIFALMLPLLTAVSSWGEDIHIAYAAPEDYSQQPQLYKRLKTKLMRPLTAGGIASAECSTIALVPELSVISENKVEGVMRTIYASKLSLKVDVVNLLTGTVFNSFSEDISGEGYSTKEAAMAAIDNLNCNSKVYADFLKNAKTKIIDYYSNNLDNLLQQAKMLTTQEKYSEAMALLSSYPQSLDGYGKVSEEIARIFRMEDDQLNEQMLLAADAAYSRREYETASDIASSVNPRSPSYAKAQKLLEKIHAAKVAEHQEATDMYKEEMKSRERIHMGYINAAKEVAKAYYGSQTSYIFL